MSTGTPPPCSAAKPTYGQPAGTSTPVGLAPELLQLVTSLLGKAGADGVQAAEWDARRDALLALADAVASRLQRRRGPGGGLASSKSLAALTAAGATPPWECVVGLGKHALLDPAGPVVLAAVALLQTVLGEEPQAQAQVMGLADLPPASGTPWPLRAWG